MLDMLQTNMNNGIFSKPSMVQRLSWFTLATCSNCSKSLVTCSISTPSGTAFKKILSVDQKRGIALDRIMKEIARDKRGSKIYQSVNRRTMAIRMTATQPRVSSRKCRLRIDSFFVFPLQTTKLASTLIVTAIIPSQRIPSSLTGWGWKSFVIFSKMTNEKVDKETLFYPLFGLQLLFATQRFHWVFLRGDAWRDETCQHR